MKDEVLHAIKSIDQIEMNVKKCQTECLLITDNIKNLQCQINEIKKDQESLHANLSSSTSKINDLITRQSRIESEALVNIPETIQDQCNAMKQSIYDDLSKRFNSEIEQSLSFSINSLKQPSTTFHIPKSPSKSNTQVIQPSTQEIQLTQKLPCSYTTVISTTPTHPPKQPNQTHNSNQNPEPPRPKTIESKDTKLPHDGKQSKTFEQENVLIGDSNIKFISSTRFPEKIAKIRCGTYQSLPETIKNIDLQNAKHIILHLGTNDIETAKSPQEFEENVLNALDAISNKYPESEITISELFPRKDTQQKKVQTANDILNKVAETTRAIFALNSRYKIKHLPIVAALKLFDSTISPILLYGSEVWGAFEISSPDQWDKSSIGKVHTQFLKRLLGVNRSTTNFLVRGELGRYPLLTQIESRICNFIKHIENDYAETSLVSQAFSYENKILNRKPMSSYVEELSTLLRNNHFINSPLVSLSKNSIKKIINSYYSYHWKSKMDECSKATLYKTHKQNISLEKYLIKIQKRKVRSTIKKYDSATTV